MVSAFLSIGDPIIGTNLFSISSIYSEIARYCFDIFLIVGTIIIIIGKRVDILKREFLLYDGKYQTAKFNANFREKVNLRDESFYFDNNCSACGICEEICPVNNIILVEGKPQWQNKCQLCLACINYCPEEAIQFEDQTKKKQRYHQPEITFQEIKAQKK